ERTNFRYVTTELFTEGLPNFATIDVSFISLRLILPVLKTVLQANSHIITLIKPQFEAERHQVGKKGIVRDKTVHKAVLNKIISFAEQENFTLLGLTYSPITGGEGNIEFLAHFGWQATQQREIEIDVKQLIDEAHEQL